MMGGEQISTGLDASADTACPDCDGGRVQRVGMFEHTTCGFVDVAAGFDAADRYLSCPKCDETLTTADDGLTCVAFVLHCPECDRRFDDVAIPSLAPQSAEAD